MQEIVTKAKTTASHDPFFLVQRDEWKNHGASSAYHWSSCNTTIERVKYLSLISNFSLKLRSIFIVVETRLAIRDNDILRKKKHTKEKY